MTERSDAELLESWSAEGSEKAFAELARRYSGLLYHATLRRTARSDLAQEAAQNALLILARKAKGLGSVPSLAGWLHRTVCYEASKLLRRERRHDARMKQVPAPDDADDSNQAWQEAAPLLDEAVDSLPAKYREVIFLRYFQGLSFEEIARRCGGESAAWRQRSSRAVEKLRVALTKRGAVVSGSALATGLGTSLSQAAPAPVLASLTASPAAGAAALSWSTLASHSLHLMKLHPTTAVFVTLLLAALPLSVQAFANASARDRIALLENSVRQASARAGTKPRDTGTSASTKVSKQSILWLAEQVAQGSRGSRQANAAARRMIRSLSEEEMHSLLREAIAIDLPPATLHGLIGQVLTHASRYTPSQVPPERFLETIGLLADHLDTKGQQLVWDYTGFVISKWTAEDPEKAIAWYRSEVKSGRLDFARLDLHAPGEIYASLRKANPQAAEEFYATLTEDERIPVIQLFKRSGAPEEFLDMAAKFEDPAKRQVPLMTIFQYGTKDKSPAEVRAWLDRTGVSGENAAALLALAAEGDPYREDGGVAYYKGMKTEQIKDRIEWLRDPAMGGESSEAIGIFLASSMKSAPQQTNEALDAEWKQHPDQEMLEAYFRHAGASVEGAADALDRYRFLEDTEAREQLLRDLLKTPAGQEILRMMRKHGIPEKELEESQIPAEFFR